MDGGRWSTQMQYARAVAVLDSRALRLFARQGRRPNVANPHPFTGWHNNRKSVL